MKNWSTRFVLEPLQPAPGRVFAVTLDEGGEARLKAVPSGKRRFALITGPPQSENPDDAAYPVIVYAGNVQGAGEGGTLSRERNRLRDLKLESVFVFEATDFMLSEYDDVTLLKSVKDMVRQVTVDVEQNEEIAGAVRLGLVEYQDSTSLADFVSRITCPLTDDTEGSISPLSVSYGHPQIGRK